MKKFTLATFKSLIRKGVLYGVEKSSFSGMTDCVERNDSQRLEKIDEIPSAIKICARGSGNRFYVQDENHFEVYNCCGLWAFTILTK